MSYEKPEIVDLSCAVTAIQAGEPFTLLKSEHGSDAKSDTRMSPSAYIADE